jgi:hypothetical protein
MHFQASLVGRENAPIPTCSSGRFSTELLARWREVSKPELSTGPTPEPVAQLGELDKGFVLRATLLTKK